MASDGAPQKLILTPAQLAYFQDSETHKSIISYIEIVNQAILSRKLTDDCPEGEVGGRSCLFRDVLDNHHIKIRVLLRHFVSWTELSS